MPARGEPQPQSQAASRKAKDPVEDEAAGPSRDSADGALTQLLAPLLTRLNPIKTSPGEAPPTPPTAPGQARSDAPGANAGGQAGAAGAMAIGTPGQSGPPAPQTTTDPFQTVAAHVAAPAGAEMAAPAGAGPSETPLPASQASGGRGSRSASQNPAVSGGTSASTPGNRTTPAVAVRPTVDGGAQPTDAGPSPAQQVLTALRALGIAPAPSAPAAGEAPGPAPAPQTADAAPAAALASRSLTIQLNPEHLGPVSVTLRMKDGAVDVRIAVATPEALQALDRDRHMLAAAVEAAGGSRDAITLAAAAPAADGAPDAPPAFNPAATGDGATASNSAAGDQARQQQRPERSSAHAPAYAHADDPQTVPAPRRDRRDGSLYV